MPGEVPGKTNMFFFRDAKNPLLSVITSAPSVKCSSGGMWGLLMELISLDI